MVEQQPKPHDDFTRDRVSVVVLTLNESRNLPACLQSVASLKCDVFVVDSGSTDGTQKIAADFGARVLSHAFTTHAEQWEWALSSIPLATPWILALDADQRLTSEL